MIKIAVTQADKNISTDSLLLKYAADLTDKPLEVIRPDGKKPYFKDKPICFSVSHSGIYWVCAFSDSEVGIDIQIMKDCNFKGISKRFFNIYEYGFLEERGFDSTCFFMIWTAKESYVKYTGRGIADGFSDFSVISDGCISGDKLNVKFNYIDCGTGYIMCLCSEFNDEWKCIN